MKTYPQWLPALAIIFAGCGGGSGGHSHGHHGHGHHDHGPTAPPDEVTLSTAAMEQNGVRVEPLTRRTFQPTHAVSARVAFNEEATAHVGTLVHGRVVKMQAHLGERVNQNDVLFVIESPELGASQNALLKALAAVVSAQTSVALAEANALTAQAQAELKSAEALIALADNPAAINAAKADLAAAQAASVLARNNATIPQAESELAAAQPAVTAAQKLVETGRKLAAAGALAQTELQRRETALQTAQAKVQAAEAALAQAKAQQERDQKSAEAALAAGQAALTRAQAQQTRDLAAAKAKQAAATAQLRAAHAKENKELTEARNALATAEAGVTQCRNQLRLLGMSADQIEAFIGNPVISPEYIVRAPRAGTVVEREITLGENASPEQPHLLMLADLATVWVLLDVPTSQAEGLKAGHPVTLVNPETGQRTEAKLDFVSPVVDTETRTVQARVVLPNAEGQWRPGQFLTVHLPGTEPARESLAVPTAAVQYVDGKPTVYVATGKDRTFKARHLRLGAEDNGWLPVQRGLSSTNRVVVSGSFLLKAEFGKAAAGHDHSH